MRISDWSSDVCSSDLAVVARTIEEFGRIDIPHNNAADTRLEQMQADASLAEMNADTWDRAFRVNTRGTMLMIKHAVPQMISAGGGSIIHTSTGVALTGDIFTQIGKGSCRERVGRYGLITGGALS